MDSINVFQYRKFGKMTKSEAFRKGFWAMLGLEKFSNERPQLSDSQVLHADVEMIGGDFKQVIHRQKSKRDGKRIEAE